MNNEPVTELESIEVPVLDIKFLGGFLSAEVVQIYQILLLLRLNTHPFTFLNWSELGVYLHGIRFI